MKTNNKIEKVNNNNNKVEVEKMEKKIVEKSVKELSEMLNFSEGCIRSWMYKGEVGVVYEVGKVNYSNVRSKIMREYSDEEFENKFGFSIFDLRISKSKKSSSREFISFMNLVENKDYILCNYSFESEVKFIKCDEEIGVWYFRKLKDNKLKVMERDEINKTSIKFVELNK